MKRIPLLLCVLSLIASCKQAPTAPVEKPAPTEAPPVQKFDYSYVPTSTSWTRHGTPSHFSASTGSFSFDHEFGLYDYESGSSFEIVNTVSHDLRRATKATLTYTVFCQNVKGDSYVKAYIGSTMLRQTTLSPLVSEVVEIPQVVYKNQPIAFSLKIFLRRTYPNPTRFTSTVSVTNIQLKASE